MDVDLGAGQRLSLAAVDPSMLGAARRIDALTELQRMRSWVDAQEQQLLATMAGPGDAPSRAGLDSAVSRKQYVREEIACALKLSPVTVNDRLHVARELTRRLPDTWALLAAGEITMRAARLLVDAVTPLPDAVATQVEARVLGRAPQQTFANFRACVQRAVLALDPREAEEKHDAAVEQRRVESRALEHGMGSLYAVLPADDLQALLIAVQACADSLPAEDYPAGPNEADQRRADALVALTTRCPTASTTETPTGDTSAASGDTTSGETTSGDTTSGDTSGRPADGAAGGVSVRPVKTRHGRRPNVQVTVALSTLLGLDNEAGELDGHGPIPAVLARRIAADPSGTWRRLVTDALGRLLDYGRSTYRPPQDLTDHVITRDRRCRFPGCRRQAVRCDIDHQLAWEDGGHTTPCNLECLCARHHALKHEAGWSVRGDPAGVLIWTTPTGHTYLDPPGEHPLDTTVPEDELGQDEAELGQDEDELGQDEDELGRDEDERDEQAA